MNRVARLIALGFIGSCAEPTAPALINGLTPDIAQAVVGTYQLQAWKALTLPALFSTNGHTCTSHGCVPNGGKEFIDAGSLTINANGTYTRVTNFRGSREDQPDAFSSATHQGSWSGNAESGPISLTFTSSGTTLNWSATISGNTLSLSVQGEPWVYVR